MNRWLSIIGLVGVFAGVGGGLGLQRQETNVLRLEIALLRDEQRELARLQAENKRLTAAQPSAVELEALRADHAAVARLRGEIERTRDVLMTRERALAAGEK